MILLRFELSAGSYIIIPATFETGAASNFMIRVTSSFDENRSGAKKSLYLPIQTHQNESKLNQKNPAYGRH